MAATQNPAFGLMREGVYNPAGKTGQVAMAADMTWQMVGSVSGTTAIQIPAAVLAAREFMINWRIGTSPKCSFVVANFGTNQSYVDSFWFSDKFHTCCAFILSLVGESPFAKAYESWFSVEYGTDNLTIDDLSWQLFWR